LAAKQQSYNSIPDWLRRSFPERGAAAIRGGGVTSQIKRSLCDLFFFVSFLLTRASSVRKPETKKPDLRRA